LVGELLAVAIGAYLREKHAIFGENQVIIVFYHDFDNFERVFHQEFIEVEALEQ
jgi:hypothetical protein